MPTPTSFARGAYNILQEKRMSEFWRGYCVGAAMCWFLFAVVMFTRVLIEWLTRTSAGADISTRA